MLKQAETIKETYSPQALNKVVAQLYQEAHSGKHHCFVAIDGPAASGKGTAAGSFSKELKYKELGYGTFARAITWLYVHFFQGKSDMAAFAYHMKKTQITRYNDQGIDKVDLRNEALFGAISLDLGSTDTQFGLRSAAVNDMVAIVSEWPVVVSYVNQNLIDQANTAYKGKKPIVIEGRDNEQIFRDTSKRNWFDTMLLVYLTAQLDVLVERAVARAEKRSGRSLSTSEVDEVKGRIVERNAYDSNREKGFGRLVTPEEAQQIKEYAYFDTSGLDERQVFYILCIWQLQKIGVKPDIQVNSEPDQLVASCPA